ncbi:MAG: hypothetical protein K0R46_3116, partial [Herbinix sp.]|nr:hypothetical protein [Herbinix sp.]
MCTKKMMRRLFSAMLILVMVFCGIVNDVTKQAQAAVNKEGGTSADFTKCINVTEKYLYMGKSGVKTFDFNIRKEAMMKGATYIWYIRTDKGNPKAVSINKKTGIVTAREAGTAYIRCKITLADGSVYRPQAIVTVINNITAVGINNLPGDATIIAGSGYDFNHSVIGTEAGKSAKTSGITGWEIADDTSGVETATAQGIVFPIKVGEFKVRAVCFSSTAKYKAWLSDKEANQAGITATSEWATIKVASSQGIATATTQEQLNKSLVADDIERIELSTDKAILLTIPRGNYDKKTLIVNTPNADIENHGIFKEIMIKAIKDSTWIEYANGNIVNLSDETASFVIKEGINVKRIVIDRADSQLNIVINGAVEQIVVLQPTSINLSGSGAQVPVTVEASAGGSAITASMPLDLELKAKTDVTLNEGAGDTSLNKSESTVVVKIQNNTDRDSVITTNHSDGESIGTGKTIISDGNKKTSEGTVVPINTPSGGPSTNPPTQPSTINVSAITVTSAGDATTVVNGGTLQMSATVAPANATNKTVTWSVINGTGSATISTNGLLTATGAGTVTIKAVANDGSLIQGNKAIIINTTALAKVTNAALGADGTATWSDVSNESSYDLQLFKNGTSQGPMINVAANTTTKNFLAAMRAAGTGNYTFTVTAKGDGVYFVNGATSDASSSQTVLQLATVNAGLTWTGNVAHWTAVTSAVSYDVQLYKGSTAVGSAVNVLSANVATGTDFTAAMTTGGSGTYTYKVTAKGNTTLILDAT